MNQEWVQVTLKGILPTPGGSGVFLEHGDKAITIFIDPMVSHALTLAMQEESSPRPLTHELMTSVLEGLGVRLDRVEIHEVKDETFFARLHLIQENELGKNLLEVDARPSDGMVLAVQTGAPVLVAREVWDAAENMKWAMEQLRSDQQER